MKGKFLVHLSVTQKISFASFLIWVSCIDIILYVIKIKATTYN